MPTLVVAYFNIVCSTVGSFTTLYGFVTFLLKDRLFFGTPYVSLFAARSLLPDDEAMLTG